MPERRSALELWDLRLTPRPAHFATWVSPWVAESEIAAYISPMATLRPGSFWGTQGEKCPVDDAEVSNAQRQQLPRPDRRSNNGDSGDQEMNDACDGNDVEKPSWEEVLPARGRDTCLGGGVAAAEARLDTPPSLGKMRL